MPAAFRVPPLDELRRAVAGQWRLLADEAAGLPEESFALPTRLAGWSVADLVGHLVSSQQAGEEALRAAGPPTAGERPVPTLAYYDGTPARAAEIDRRARAAARSGPAGLREALAGAVDRCVTVSEGVRPGWTLRVPAGTVTVETWLATRCVEGVVHALDLAAAVGIAARADRAATGVAVRLLAGVLADRFPGRTVEVRVPPVAAVQCLAGPRHSRGTPPNVVETDPVTFLELATGRLAWAEALVDARVSASGGRADLAAQLPLLS